MYKKVAYSYPFSYNREREYELFLLKHIDSFTRNYYVKYGHDGPSESQSTTNAKPYVMLIRSTNRKGPKLHLDISIPQHRFLVIMVLLKFKLILPKP